MSRFQIGDLVEGYPLGIGKKQAWRILILDIPSSSADEEIYTYLYLSWQDSLGYVNRVGYTTSSHLCVTDTKIIARAE